MDLDTINNDSIDVNGMDLTTDVGFLQPSLMNYGDANSAQLLNGNYLANLTVGGNVNTTFNISDGTIVHSNGILKILETADARAIHFDVDTSSLQPFIRATNKLIASFITGLSNVTTHISNASNGNGFNILYNDTIGNLSVVCPKTTTNGVGHISHATSY
jgi:hypothetical protein